MININKVIDNPFDALHDYRRDVVQLFIYLHILYMESQLIDYPYLAPYITAAWIKYNDMFGVVKDKDQKISLRKSQRKTVVEAMDDFKKGAHTVESRVRDKKGKGSPIYNELFPDGLDGYNHIILENSYLLIDRLVDGTTKYVAELGVDMQDLMADLFTEFDEARKAQVDSAGKVRSNNPKYTAKLNVMNVQLYLNLHSICGENKDNIDLAKGYFNQSVLDRAVHHAGDPNKEPKIIGIQPLTQKEAEVAYGINDKITLKNMGKVPLSYMGAFTADEPIHPNSQVLLPGQSITLTAEQLGSPNNKYLIIANNDTELLGAIKITLE